MIFHFSGDFYCDNSWSVLVVDLLEVCYYVLTDCLWSWTKFYRSLATFECLSVLEFFKSKTLSFDMEMWLSKSRSLLNALGRPGRWIMLPVRVTSDFARSGSSPYKVMPFLYLEKYRLRRFSCVSSLKVQKIWARVEQKPCVLTVTTSLLSICCEFSSF